MLSWFERSYTQPKNVDALRYSNIGEGDIATKPAHLRHLQGSESQGTLSEMYAARLSANPSFIAERAEQIKRQDAHEFKINYLNNKNLVQDDYFDNAARVQWLRQRQGGNQSMRDVVALEVPTTEDAVRAGSRKNRNLQKFKAGAKGISANAQQAVSKEHNNSYIREALNRQNITKNSTQINNICFCLMNGSESMSSYDQGRGFLLQIDAVKDLKFQFSELQVRIQVQSLRSKHIFYQRVAEIQRQSTNKSQLTTTAAAATITVQPRTQAIESLDLVKYVPPHHRNFLTLQLRFTCQDAKQRQSSLTRSYTLKIQLFDRYNHFCARDIALVLKNFTLLARVATPIANASLPAPLYLYQPLRHAAPMRPLDSTRVKDLAQVSPHEPASNNSVAQRRRIYSPFNLNQNQPYSPLLQKISSIQAREDSVPKQSLPPAYTIFALPTHLPGSDLQPQKKRPNYNLFNQEAQTSHASLQDVQHPRLNKFNDLINQKRDEYLQRLQPHWQQQRQQQQQFRGPSPSPPPPPPPQQFNRLHDALDRELQRQQQHQQDSQSLNEGKIGYVAAKSTYLDGPSDPVVLQHSNNDPLYFNRYYQTLNQYNIAAQSSNLQHHTTFQLLQASQQGKARQQLRF